MKRFLLAVAAVAALVLNGCAQNTLEPAPTDDVPISQRTLDNFKRYEAEIGSTHPGAFAVSLSGRNSYGYYCPDVNCMVESGQGVVAVRRCTSFGEPCYLFAVSDHIRYKYHVN